MRNLFLVGPMGSGKSTIGRLLAKELRLPFKDSDKVIEERTGAAIPWIFDMEGEQGFRERERAAIAELCAENGLVIYLHASIEQQIERTARDRNRPLLQTADPAAVLRTLMTMRDPLYREIADIIVETDERPPRLVVLQILDRLKALAPH